MFSSVLFLSGLHCTVHQTIDLGDLKKNPTKQTNKNLALRTEHLGDTPSSRLAASKIIFQFAAMALGSWQALLVPALQGDAPG